MIKDMDDQSGSLAKRLNFSSPLKLFGLVIVGALIIGVITGKVLASKGGGSLASGTVTPAAAGTSPTSAQADASTFKDFAEGVIQNKPLSSSDTYAEGAYLLVRQGQDPVALTSSVVDLSQYVGKKVKVYGQTQQALQAGWLMDVGRVDVEQ